MRILKMGKELVVATNLADLPMPKALQNAYKADGQFHDALGTRLAFE